ncbi:MAG: 7-cyano-7-deazaguanine synthase QueC [Methanoculleaceae archaeon]
MTRKAVVLLSGGMDSATLAYHARAEGYEICVLHATYGQRTARKERHSAEMIASRLDAREFFLLDLGFMAGIGGSSLTDPDIPVGYATSASGVPDTYVPFRNGVLLSVATSYAEARGAEAIYIAVQSVDYAGYPDCRPSFIQAFQRVIDEGTAPDTRIMLKTPFIGLNKEQILRRGLELGVPYELTWSCYQSEDAACGVCSSCRFRRAAFDALGVKDPIRYRGEGE